MSMQTIKYVASYFYGKICVITENFVNITATAKANLFLTKEKYPTKSLKIHKMSWNLHQNKIIWYFFAFHLYFSHSFCSPCITFIPYSHTRIFIYFYLFQFLFFIHHLRIHAYVFTVFILKLFILVLFFLPIFYARQTYFCV